MQFICKTKFTAEGAEDVEKLELVLGDWKFVVGNWYQLMVSSHWSLAYKYLFFT